jgi:ATP-dependent Clp protease ATP-binding subunit ClpC
MEASEKLTPVQAKAVDIACLERFLASDIAEQIRKSDSVLREYRFTMLMDAAQYDADIHWEEKILLQGVVDCCFETDGVLTVVDFKTDQVDTDWEIRRRAETYRPQLEAYSRALEQILEKKVMGQAPAVQAVAEAVRRGSSGIRDPRRPVACLMFTGPTGVGKTELCRALAEEVYGSREAMIRLDMTEYMEKHSVSRLIGAPPGYVGHEEGGKLTEAVRRRPYCLVLLDELEKAHPDVAGILLQIMEEGDLTDATGRKVSFKNAIVVMTSNVGSNIQGEGLGFRPGGHAKEQESALRQCFTPEFVGRLDRIVTFSPLTQEAISAIAGKYLRELTDRMAAMGIKLQLPEELAENLARKCKPKDGARHLRRLVQDEVEGPLAEFLLRCGEKPGALRVEMGGAGVVIHK